MFRIKYILVVVFISMIFSGNLLSQRSINFQMAFSHILKNQVDFVRISDDSNYYMIKCSDNTIYLFNKDGSLKWDRQLDGKNYNGEFSFNGDSFIVLNNKKIVSFDLNNGLTNEFNIKNKKQKSIPFAVFSGKFAFSNKKNWYIGDSKSGIIINTKKKSHKKNIKYINFLSNNKLLTIGDENSIKIWNIDSGKELMNNIIHPSKILSSFVSFDKKYIVLATYNFKINSNMLRSSIARQSDLKKKFKLKIYNLSSLILEKEIDIGSNYIRDLSLSADNKFASILKDDGSVDIWGLENGYLIKTFGNEKYTDLDFDMNGEYFLLTSKSGRISKWETKGIHPSSSGPQFIGSKYKINSPKQPLIDRSQKGLSIAIMDFSSALISKDVGEAVSSIFRNRLSNYKYINVVERESMNKVLEEQGFQNTGLTSTINAVEIGKLLNVQKLIMGKISALGSTLIVTLKLVDIETGKIEASREVESQNYTLESIPELIDVLLSIFIEK